MPRDDDSLCPSLDPPSPPIAVTFLFFFYNPNCPLVVGPGVCTAWATSKRSANDKCYSSRKTNEGLVIVVAQTFNDSDREARRRRRTTTSNKSWWVGEEGVTITSPLPHLRVPGHPLLRPPSIGVHPNSTFCFLTDDHRSPNGKNR